MHSTHVHRSTHYFLSHCSQQQLFLLPTPYSLTYSPWLHVFHFLNVNLSFLSVCVCLCVSEYISVSVCLCLCTCLSVLTARDRLFSENRSPDTEKQQVKAIFWHLLVAAGLFVRPAQRQVHCTCGRMCVCVCVCSLLTEAGEITPAWSGLLFLSTSVWDKTEGP